jgi:hemerythrin superfamily protein
MKSIENLEDIWPKVEKLDKEDQLMLAEKILSKIHQENQSRKTKSLALSDLKNLGSEIWKDIDVKQYLQDLRQWD